MVLSPAEIYASRLVFIFFSGLLGSKIATHVFGKLYEYFMYRFDEEHSEIARRLETPINWILNIAVFYFLFREMSIPVVTDIGMKLMLTIGSFIVLVSLGNIAEPVMRIAMKRAGANDRTKKQVVPIVRDLARIVFAVVAVVLSLLIWGINVGPLITSAGLVTAALAFAVQSIISDFFYGMIILFDGRIRVGDFVNVNGYSGKVIEIGSLSTKIETWDSTQVTVPNSVIGKEYLENIHLPGNRSKVKLKIGVSYDSNLKKVKAVLEKILREHPKVLDDPAPGVYLTAMLDSAIEFTTVAYVSRPEDRFSTAVELREKIIEEFRKHNIDIPYPITTVYLKKG